ncbi:MAG TPA: extracellular solute-binding protein [Burkholderiales bacterium]|nr:extracellular solute-binding protein [Burkholderiales bacterium]
MQLRSRLGTLFVLLAWLMPALAIGQSAGKNDDVLLYQGADRQLRLVEKARKEGGLTVYTSLAPTEAEPMAQAFEKKYGIKVELWRALSERVLQRTLSEAKADRNAADVIATNSPELESLVREKVLAPYYTPYAADLPRDSIPKHRLWMPDRLTIFVVGYNTRLVRREELPKSYLGFADPKWKGRIGIEASDSEWMATLVKKWGQEPGMAFFRKLAELKPEVRKGHVLLAQLISAGEIPVGLTVYSSNAETLKRKGAPIDWVAVDPAVARPQGLAIPRNAPHPAAAVLYADFVLSPEGQKMYEDMGRPPVSTRIKSSLSNFNYTMLDPVTVLDEADKWSKLWDELFLKKQ